MNAEVSPGMWNEHPFVRNHYFACNIFSRTQMAAYQFDGDALGRACLHSDVFAIEDIEGRQYVEMGHA